MEYSVQSSVYKDVAYPGNCFYDFPGITDSMSGHYRLNVEVRNTNISFTSVESGFTDVANMQLTRVRIESSVLQIKTSKEDESFPIQSKQYTILLHSNKLILQQPACTTGK